MWCVTPKQICMCNIDRSACNVYDFKGYLQQQQQQKQYQGWYQIKTPQTEQYPKQLYLTILYFNYSSPWTFLFEYIIIIIEIKTELWKSLKAQSRPQRWAKKKKKKIKTTPKPKQKPSCDAIFNNKKSNGFFLYWKNAKLLLQLRPRLTKQPERK